MRTCCWLFLMTFKVAWQIPQKSIFLQAVAGHSAKMTPMLIEHTGQKFQFYSNNYEAYLSLPFLKKLIYYKIQSNLAIRNKLVLRNHFLWPIFHLLHKDKELLALRNNFRTNKKFLIAKFDCATNKLSPHGGPIIRKMCRHWLWMVP